jgi:hypothetical protein
MIGVAEQAVPVISTGGDFLAGRGKTRDRVDREADLC